MAAVVLNWNLPDLTLECLAALAASDEPLRPIVVVDNGSTDDSVARIQGTPDVDLHALSTNRGFAAGANIGLRAALAAGATREPFTFYFTVALDFLALTTISVLLLGWAERRYSAGFVRVD